MTTTQTQPSPLDRTYQAYDRYDNLVGSSKSFAEVFEQIQQAFTRVAVTVVQDHDKSKIMGVYLVTRASVKRV